MDEQSWEEDENQQGEGAEEKSLGLTSENQLKRHNLMHPREIRKISPAKAVGIRGREKGCSRNLLRLKRILPQNSQSIAEAKTAISMEYPNARTPARLAPLLDATREHLS